MATMELTSAPTGSLWAASLENYKRLAADEKELTHLVDVALAYVNEARAALGYPRLLMLPKGAPKDAENCALARALPHCLSVAGTIEFDSIESARKVAQAWHVLRHGRVVEPPAALAGFPLAFDQRLLPQLIV